MKAKKCLVKEVFSEEVFVTVYKEVFLNTVVFYTVDRGSKIVNPASVTQRRFSFPLLGKLPKNVEMWLITRIIHI